jgi:hypothetical protein
MKEAAKALNSWSLFSCTFASTSDFLFYFYGQHYFPWRYHTLLLSLCITLTYGGCIIN